MEERLLTFPVFLLDLADFDEFGVFEFYALDHLAPPECSSQSVFICRDAPIRFWQIACVYMKDDAGAVRSDA